MITARAGRAVLAVVMVVCAGAAAVLLVRDGATSRHSQFTAYFANSNGIYAGDEVRVLGVPVGKIDRIEPQPHGAKITFWVDDRYPIPAGVDAAIISPALVAVRAIQLTPAYTGGPELSTGAVIPEQRTAVPVEWDDFRDQLQKLTESLQPTTPGGVSPLGEFVSTAANNLRGQGTSIHDTLAKLSQAFSALGDHSGDLFATVKNVSTLTSALQSSEDLMRQLNQNLAGVTALLAAQPDDLGDAVANIDGVVGDVEHFVTTNKQTLTTTSQKLALVSTALNDSLGDLKQVLHIAPNTFANFLNIYQPAQATLTGALAFNNFANPISFICGAIQAASRLNAEQSSKLCVQYLSPIIKNRQINFPPIGENLFVGASARPNELTYSEDWLRPDYVPPAPTAPPAASDSSPSAAPETPPLPAEVQPTDPNKGLEGMMLPGGGS